MLLIDTNERLLNHFEARVKALKGRCNALKRDYRKPGVQGAGITQKDMRFSEGQVLAMEEALSAIETYIEQSTIVNGDKQDAPR